MRKRDGSNLFCAGLFEDAGCLFKRGAGGFYVIYENDRFALYLILISEGKDMFHILAPAFGRKRCLGRGGSGADERVRIKREWHMRAYVLRKKERLIKSPHALFTRMQGDGHKDRLRWQCDAVIGHI